MNLEAAHALYALLWLSFGFVHSWLAGAGVKGRMQPFFGAYYRLVYNLIAAAHLGAIGTIGAWMYEGGHETVPFTEWRGFLSVLAVAGWTLMILALRTYDVGRLLGTAQIRDHRTGRPVDDDEPLITTGFHAYMRHPLYTAGYLILWGAAWTDLGLMTAVWGTLYLFIGSRFEERRLRRLYGEAYRDYALRVPAFFPWRGKAI